jgi:rfaE bifunctional protein nucleotidyltransferase chain/domain
MRTGDTPVRAKAVELERLAEILREHRERGETVAQCHGVFDLLHVGHLRHFQRARERADVLVVTVTPDRFVNKGPGRPAFNEALRCETLAALDCVDYVAINRWPTATEAIRLLRPRFYVKGSEYRKATDDVTGKISEEQEAVESVGGELMFTDDLVFSSSTLLNTHLTPFPDEVRTFLEDFRSQFSFRDVLGWFDRVSRSHVLLVGETILDEYHYCQTIGKSGKEPILAARYTHAEKHAGGVLAIANHLAAFCRKVTLVTQLGEQDSQEEFVRASLHPAVEAHCLKVKDAPTIVKRRFVESYPFQKLFEIYVMNDEPGEEAQADLLEALRPRLEDADVVVAADYGHGMLEGEAVELLSRESPFLCLNTQKNAGNHGFNTVSKYPRADFVSISEGELRLDARRKSAPIEGLVDAVARRMHCRSLIVTRGQSGCLCFSPTERPANVPALTSSVTDRVGAGDAVFAVTSLLSHVGAPLPIVGLCGNSAGAQAVATVGNRSALDRVALLKHVQHLLK